MKAVDAPPIEEPGPERGPRLDSWKEIAAYFQRDVRTVRRWEAAEGLPVHRLHHRRRGSVYAYKGELDSWLRSSQDRRREAPAARPIPVSVRWTWIVGIAALAVSVLALGIWYAGRRSAEPPALSARAVRVAVLPFDGPKDDAQTEPLGDILAADIVSKLGRLGPERLGVVAYTSATSYRGSGKRGGQIGRELRVDYLVEGSLRRKDEGVLLNVRLVSTSDETLARVWEYERDSRALAGLADEVADDLSRGLGVPLTSARGGRPAVDSIDREAQQFYLRARYHLVRRTGKLALARQYLEMALARAPQFAPAHAALAETFTRMARRSAGKERADAWANAEASTRRALAIDNSLPAAHVALATILLFRDWDWTAAEAEYRRALQIDSLDQDACHGYGTYLVSVGRMDDAIVQRQRALQTDPLNVTLITLLGDAYVFARQYDAAIREFEKALELEPNSQQAVGGIADAYARKGLEAKAGAQTVRLLTLRGSQAMAGEFERRWRTDGFRQAQQWLDQRALETYSRNPSTHAWNLAYTNARLGNTDAAFRWLDTAFAGRDAGLLQMRVDPDLDSLRADPRFQDLLRRVGPR